MYVSGEPRAMKVACVVRRGTDEKGQMMYLVSGLPYNILAEGLSVSACGGGVRPVRAKARTGNPQRSRKARSRGREAPAL
jgi:hypothetical protein